jgi:GDP-4-dehydro-6-deoxy-D-mannose reductase
MRAPKKILILGHTGLLGRTLADLLRINERGAKIHGTSRKKSKKAGLTTHICDIRKAKDVTSLLRSIHPDWIFHAAGSPGAAAPVDLFESHLLSTSILLEAAASLKGKKPRIILAGSAAEYGIIKKSQLPVKESMPCRPINPYGVVKSAQTELARQYAAQGLDVVMARIFNILGPGLHKGLALSSFIDQVVQIEKRKKKGELKVGDLSAKRDFVDIIETAGALKAIALNGRRGETYNICSGQSITMRSLVDELIRRSTARIKIKIDAARLRPADIPDMKGCTKKTFRTTGWKASVTPYQSLTAMLENRRAEK